MPRCLYGVPNKRFETARRCWVCPWSVPSSDLQSMAPTGPAVDIDEERRPETSEAFHTSESLDPSAAMLCWIASDSAVYVGQRRRPATSETFCNPTYLSLPLTLCGIAALLLVLNAVCRCWVCTWSVPSSVQALGCQLASVPAPVADPLVARALNSVASRRKRLPSRGSRVPFGALPPLPLFCRVGARPLRPCPRAVARLFRTPT